MAGDSAQKAVTVPNKLLRDFFFGKVCKMATIRPEDLGSMGECFFKSLCKSAGLIANKSDDDKGGWDYEIEHPRHQTINYSSHSYPVYRIQVKSTSSSSRQCRITYSNLLNLIQYHGAAFVVLLVYNDGTEPCNAYICHVDKQLSLDILTDIRKKQLRSPDFKLNKRYKIMKFNDSHAIYPLAGSELVKAFDRNIGDDYLGYVERKAEYLRYFEKEGKRQEATFIFKEKSELASFANCFIGFSSEFKIDCETYNAPLGIRDERPKSRNEGLVTTIRANRNSIPNVSVTLKNSQHGKEYRFAGWMYMVPSDFPSDLWATRIETSLFDIVLRCHDSGFNGFQSKNIFDNDIRVSFRELYNFLSYLNCSWKSENIFIKLESDSAEKPTEICLGKTISEIPDDFSFIHEVIEATYLRIREHNLDEREVSTKDIISNINHCHCISLADKSFKPEYRFDFEARNTKVASADAVIFNATIRFIDKSFVALVAFFGTITRGKENWFEGKFNRSQLLGEYIVSLDSNEKDPFLISEENKFRIELAGQGYTVL